MAKEGQTYERLLTALKHRNFRPLYFWFGTERFLMEELQEHLIQCALAPHERDFNLDIVYGSEADARDVLVLCRSFPMMAERRVIIVREFERLKQRQLFAAYARQPNPSAVVVLVCTGRPNLSVNPYRVLKQHADWAEFKPLKEREVPRWIQQRLSHYQKEIAPDALQALVDMNGVDLQRLHQEIEKLVNYADGRSRLTLADVLAVGGHAKAYNVFELQRAIGQLQYEKALYILEQMLQHISNEKREALRIISVLTAYFLKLWKLTTCQREGWRKSDIAAWVGIQEWYLKEYQAVLKNFSPSAISRAFKALLKAEHALKGGREASERVVLTEMLREILPAKVAPSTDRAVYASV